VASYSAARRGVPLTDLREAAFLLPAFFLPADVFFAAGFVAPSAAAILGAGIGCLALGILTTLAEASADFANLLKISADVGPLSGKVIYSIVFWLVAWGALHFTWHARQINFGKVFTATLILIGLGFLGTFPIFFDLFAPK